MLYADWRLQLQYGNCCTVDGTNDSMRPGGKTLPEKCIRDPSYAVAEKQNKRPVWYAV
jgi:hypothetical protein